MDFPDPGVCARCGGDGDEDNRAFCRECNGTGRRSTTPNGYDQRWIDAINGALEDRGANVRAVDLDDPLWHLHLGTLVDHFEGPNVRADLVVITSLEGRAWNLIHRLAAQTTKPGLGSSDLAQLARAAQDLLDDS